MKAYDVYKDNEVIDTVFWNDNSDEEEVKESLINHDGYDPDIKVKLSEEIESHTP